MFNGKILFKYIQISKAILFFTILWIAIVYFFTRNKHINFGDSLPILYTATAGYDLSTNATSHFLYINTCHLATTIFQSFNPISVLTVFSISFSLLTLIQLFNISLLLTQDKVVSALCVIICAFSFTYWRQTIIVEVYTFNSFIISTIIFLVVKDLKEGNKDFMYMIGTLLGMSMLVHIQNILFLPAYFFYLTIKASQGKLRGAFTSLFLAILISGLLLLPPLISNTNSISAIFFDNHFQSQVLSMSIRSILLGFGISIIFLIYNFHLYLLFVIPGIIRTKRQHPAILKFLGLIIIPYWVFFMRYSVSDNYVFYLIPYLAIIPIIGMGILHIKSKKRLSWIKPLTYFFLFICLSPLIYKMTCGLLNAVPQAKKFHLQKAYKGGISYYCWPGMENSKDPLKIAKDHYVLTNSDTTPPFKDFDRYEFAIKYLKMQKTLK